jgi:uncharacterized protein YoxC
VGSIQDMDPLSITASAIALITVCVQTIQSIKSIIETVKGAKTRLLQVLNATTRVRLLLEQLRSLTHQLSSKSNTILLAFDGQSCGDVLTELVTLVKKLMQSDKLAAFQFLLQKSKLEGLAGRLKGQEDAICTVLLSIAT